MGITALVKKFEIPQPVPEVEAETPLVQKVFDFVTKNEHHEERSPGFHCSQIYYDCAKMWVLDNIFPENKKPSNPDPELQLMFDIGHAMHDWYQNKYLGPAGILKGDWFCKSCKNISKGFMPKICACGAKHSNLEYIEPLVEDKTLRIVGHSDGIIEVVPGVERVLEIKTINPTAFTALKEHLPAHHFQVNLYMHLLNIHRATILYINKTSGELKEFEIDYDPGVWRQAEALIGSIMKVARLARDNGGMIKPEWMSHVRHRCTRPDTQRALSCPQRGPCFDLDGSHSKPTKWKLNPKVLPTIDPT